MQRLTWQEWMEAVDQEVARQCGLSYRDIPDVAYRDMYDGGVSPEDAARYAVRYAQDEDPDSLDLP